MLKVTVNNKTEHNIELNDANGGSLDGKDFQWDIIKVKDGSYHAIKDNKSYNVEVIKADATEKSFVLSVNGNKYQLHVKDKYDVLLKSLGLDNLTTNKIVNVKAPMPGLVLEIRVEEGVAVKKGEPILVLEAMKMENIIKSPTDGVVKKINVKKGLAVEKNQVMITFA